MVDRTWKKPKRQIKQPIEARKTAGDPNSHISWKELSEILGPPPYGKAGTSVNPAGDVYGEANPNSAVNAQKDYEKFIEVAGRKPTTAELRMIHQRWLGWGYE